MKEKFNFVEFSSDGVVKTLISQENTDEQIRNAVVDHLSKIMQLSNITDQAFYSSNKKVMYSEKDLENIKNDSFLLGKEEGINETTQKYEAIIASAKNSNELIQNLTHKLSEILEKNEPIDDYIDLVSLILESILEKVSIDFPSNFSSILNDQFKLILEKSLSEKKIIVKVHSNKKSMIEDIIKSESTRFNIKNIEIIPEETIPENNCTIEYENTKLIYDRAYITNEITQILEQFKQDN